MLRRLTIVPTALRFGPRPPPTSWNVTIQAIECHLGDIVLTIDRESLKAVTRKVEVLCDVFPTCTISGSTLRSRSSSPPRAWNQDALEEADTLLCGGCGLLHVTSQAVEVGCSVGQRARQCAFGPKFIRGSAPRRRPKSSQFHMQQHPRNLLWLTPGCSGAVLLHSQSSTCTDSTLRSHL